VPKAQRIQRWRVRFRSDNGLPKVKFQGSVQAKALTFSPALSSQLSYSLRSLRGGGGDGW
jgi:hypothetical protein